MHIDNLYKSQHILAFRRCFALEKVHGTSAHARWNKGALTFSSGGEKHERFVSLFDADALTAAFAALGHDEVTVYGEAYGGKQQGMSATYGPALCFIVFDVMVGTTWLSVPNAADIAAKLGLEFVPFAEGPTDLDWLHAQRDADSEVAVRRGMGPGKLREGVVLRPPFEITMSNGARLIAKHKRDEFRETATPREVKPEQAAALAAADAIAQEWVTNERLRHVLDKLPGEHGMERTPEVIRAMVADVEREAEGEIVVSTEARKAIGSRTVALFKAHVAGALSDATKET